MQIHSIFGYLVHVRILYILCVLLLLADRWSTYEVGRSKGLFYALPTSWKRDRGDWWGYWSTKLHCLSASWEQDACTECYNASFAWLVIQISHNHLEHSLCIFIFSFIENSVVWVCTLQFLSLLPLQSLSMEFWTEILAFLFINQTSGWLSSVYSLISKK